jgi:hypothetical protein
MKEKRYQFPLQVLLAAIFALAITREARANSYASSLTNNAGEVSFRLNDAADSVKIIGNNNALTIDLGALPRGLTVTNLASRGLTTGVFKVVVAKNGDGTPAPIGGPVAFNSPRGVTVNQNPTSPYFGWVYVANSAAGTKGDGLFAFTADLFDILGQGATAKTGDLAGNFATGTTSSPYRPKVGWEDSKVYVADWSDGAGNLYKFMPDLSADPSGSYVLKPLEGTAVTPVVTDTQNNNHGSVAAVEVLGSLANGNYQVFTIDEDYQEDPTSAGLTQLNSFWVYNIGGGPLPSANPPDARIAAASVGSVSQTMDLAYSPTTGFFYISDRRSAGAETGLRVVDKDGNLLFNSREASLALGGTTDFLADIGGVAVSYDGKYVATCTFGNNVVTIVPMIGGIPDLTLRKTYTGFGTTSAARGIAFDRANNLYLASSGLGNLQSLSLGFAATNTTSSDGVFTQIAPEIQASRVSVVLFNAGSGVVDTLNEADTATIATIQISRVSPDNTNPMSVSFVTEGAATRGTATTGDYFLRVGGNALSGNSVTIPAGSDQVLIEVVANNDDISERIETATLTLTAGAYTITSDSAATVSIVDNDPVAFEVVPVFSRAFEGNPFDILRYRVERLGDTNAGPFVVNLQYSGTATSGTDYTPVASVTINPNDLSATFDIAILPDTAIEGNETVIASISPGTGYIAGPNNAGAIGDLIDDDFPAENVLFQDNFNDANSANNWTVRFGSVNPASQDYTATFGYDYGPAGLNLPPAPHSSGDTLGLLLSVNKTDGLLEAAGLNVYPNGKDFTGDYALRFDMYLMQNFGNATTEHALLGLNHDGTHTNWFDNSSPGVPSGWTFDGLFAAVIADASDLGDYVLFSAPQAGNIPGPTTLAQRSASTLTQVFHQPPWTAGGGAGSPGNTPESTTPSWAQVELRQIEGVVTLIINQTNIITYTNTTAFTHGNIMLGYDDSFNSVPDVLTGGFAIFDNVRVVSFQTVQPEVRITSIARSGDTVTVDFTTPQGQNVDSVKLYSAPTVVGPFVEDTTAIITSLGGTSFRATTTSTDAMRFYMIRARD